MYYFIEFLRAIATALVANSHFKGVYPNDFLSFGGGYGLALFFMISGYLLANINKDTKFTPWFLRKVMRLYVPLYIVRIIELIGRTKVSLNVQSFVIDFVFPGTWFGGVLIIMYVLYFLVVRYWLKGEKNNKAWYVICICAFCYFALFVLRPGIASFSIQKMSIVQPLTVETPYLISQFIWFACMMIGYWLRVNKPSADKSTALAIMFMLSIVSFLAVKLLTRNGNNMNAEIFLGLIYMTFATTLFLLLSSIEIWCRKVWLASFGKLVSVISASSLEIYYIQFFWIELLKDVRFPVNLLLLIITIVTSGFAIHWVSEKIINKITRVEKSK